MSKLTGTHTTRIALFATVLLVLAVAFTGGSAAAHNPACEQPAGPDGPHYDDDPQTGSQTAFEKNPTLGGSFDKAAVDSCETGTAQSGQSDH